MNYIEANGNNPFQRWVSERDPKVQAFIDDRLLAMMIMDRWPEKWASRYKGVDKLIELRVTHNKIQWRPLGCYGPERKHFTLLAGAVEKGGKIEKSTINTAERRLSELEKDSSRVARHNFI